jgi:hypothetical protein
MSKPTATPEPPAADQTTQPGSKPGEGTGRPQPGKKVV